MFFKIEHLVSNILYLIVRKVISTDNQREKKVKFSLSQER